MNQSSTLSKIFTIFFMLQGVPAQHVFLGELFQHFLAIELSQVHQSISLINHYIAHSKPK